MGDRVRVRAVVDHRGVLIPETPTAMKAWLAKRKQQVVWMDLLDVKDVRSRQANNYWWGVVVKFFQERWSVGRKEAGLPPYTKNQAHDVLVQVIMGTEEGPVKGTKIQVDTHDMSKETFGKLTEGAKEMAWQDFQAVLPDPEEVEA